MENGNSKEENTHSKVIAILLGLPWVEIITEAWKLGSKMLRGMTNEGIYEVLDYQCQLELQDKTGKIASIMKQEKVRYLQDYITSYQDQAWGDGEILLNYHCSPGKPVDEFRLGHKTYKLISLREFRNKGDTDEFVIKWKMRNGFLKRIGFWGTSINHRTNKVTVKIIFPKYRPPLQVSIFESNLQKSQILGKDAQKVLPNGMTIVTWEITNPRLYENYILRWEW